MKKQTFTIKLMNVTGSESNEWCLLELSKAGFPVGSVIENVVYNPETKACYWSKGNNDCVAYLGQTCMRHDSVINVEKTPKISQSITIESLKETLLNRAVLQAERTLKSRDFSISRDKNPKDSRLFNLYIGQLMGMVYMLREIEMEEAERFDWVWDYGI